LVGNFLSRHVSTRTVGEELAVRLRQAGWPVTSTSEQMPRLLRLLDMQRTIWWGGPYAVAQVDVYSGAAFRWAEAACWSLRRLGTPYALTLHGGRLPELAERRPRRVRRLLGSARAVTTPSRFLQRTMEPYREDLRLLPNPLDLDAYPFAVRERPGPRLVWLRAFHRVYNPALAPRVLARLVVDHPQATLAMIGPDKGDGSLESTRREASALGVAARITFLGGVPKDDVGVHLGHGDVFLNTSDADNAPVSVTEAMACGLCVVTTDAGGLRDLVDDGEDALVVPRDDAEAMAAAVRRLLAEPRLAARLSAAARAKVEPLSWSRLLPEWEALLRANTRPLRPSETDR
jgi:glycosyltransferase involved in cell wall biosynthesis